MKFLCLALLASISADQPPKGFLRTHGVDSSTAWEPGSDMQLTEAQESCFFDKNPKYANCTSDPGRAAFDRSVQPWHQNQDENGKYLIPMLVDIKSYPVSYRKTAWKNFLWAQKHFADHTNINLQFIDEYEANNIFVTKDRNGRKSGGYLKPFYGGSCWSFVGKVDYYALNGGQKMDIGWCHKIPGSIVHETMHALGFVHEHSRNDRDNYIYVNSRDKVNCGKYERNQLETAGTYYDFESIMHYGEGACGIRLKRGYQQYRSKVGQRSRLSAQDIRGVNHIYPRYS